MAIRHVAAAAALMVPAALAAQAIQPGQWEIVTTVNSMTMPGMPPAVAAQMKAKPTTVRHCVSPADAKAGPRELMKSTNKSCTFTRYNMTGGKLDAVMSCKQGGGKMTVTSKGSFGPASYASRSQMVMSGPQKMTMDVSATGKRVGACK